jgi:hypothetical protein
MLAAAQLEGHRLKGTGFSRYFAPRLASGLHRLPRSSLWKPDELLRREAGGSSPAQGQQNLRRL